MFFTNTNTSRRDGRDGDIQELQRGLHSSDAQIRANAQDSARRIRNESGDIRSMREALIREHRKGRVDNVKDIHEHVKRHDARYLNRT